MLTDTDVVSPKLRVVTSNRKTDSRNKQEYPLYRNAVIGGAAKTPGWNTQIRNFHKANVKQN